MSKIKELREGIGLSQRKFADKFKIPVANVQAWEQGVNKPLDYVVYMIETIIVQEKELEQYRQ